MKALIFHSGSLQGYPSGEEKVAAFEERYLLRHGVDARLVVVGPHGRVGWRRVFNKLISIFTVVWSWSAYRFVSREISKFRPDIVHFHGLTPFLSASALAAARRAGVGVVQTLHNGRWLCLEGGFYRNGKYCDKCVGANGWEGIKHGCRRGRLMSTLFFSANQSGRFNGRLFKWVDRFVAVSHFIRYQHLSTGFPAEKVVVKYNGMDLIQLRAVHNKTGLRKGIAFVSRISEAKGSWVLRSIVAAIRDDIHVVGDGPDLAELKAFCERAGHQHVTFWGHLPPERCLDIMANVMCTVVPSQCGESFSLVATESMGLGTPVVGSDVGGLGPLLRDSGGGIPVNPEDVQGFIDAIQTLLTRPEHAALLGQSGRRYVEEYLDADRNIRELIGIYESVLQERKRHAIHV